MIVALADYWMGLIGVGVLAMIGLGIYSAFKLKDADPWGDR